MSNKKTISINPKLFNISKTKTRKNKHDKKQNVTIVNPNLFKSKILRRIQKHKSNEVKKNKNQQLKTNDNIDDDNKDEFTKSINYLNNLVKREKNNSKQKNKKQKTFKNNDNLGKTNMNVNVDLPEELEEINSTNVVLNDVPYGILKKVTNQLIVNIIIKQ